MASSAGREAALYGIGAGKSRGAGRTVVLQLFASWCAPCEPELRALAAARERFVAAGVEVVGLALDEGDTRAAALALLEEVEWPYSRGFLAPDSARVLETVVGALLDQELALPVPASFVVDPLGGLVAVRLGKASPDELLTAAQLVSATPAERLEAATPFAGRWIVAPSAEPDLYRLQVWCERAGLEQAAAEYQRGQLSVEHLNEASFQYEVGIARARQGDIETAARMFQKTTKLDPTHVEAWRALGAARYQTGEFLDARNAWREALTLDPDHGPTRLNLGLVALELDDRALAQRQLDALTQIRSTLAIRLRDAVAAWDAAGEEDGE